MSSNSPADMIVWMGPSRYVLLSPYPAAVYDLFRVRKLILSFFAAVPVRYRLSAESTIDMRND